MQEAPEMMGGLVHKSISQYGHLQRANDNHFKNIYIMEVTPADLLT